MFRQHFGVGSIPWSPLARGLICRPFADASSDRQKTDAAAEYLYRPDDYKAIVDAAETVAKARNITMAQVALAWVLSKEQVSAPIVGTTSLNNLHDLISKSSLYPSLALLTRYAEAIHIKLTDDEITSLEAGYKPMPVSGHS
jgi:aryl-alcohol dehydrogenase-like predicted oxidoreductase